jgi:hypothetical protein
MIKLVIVCLVILLSYHFSDIDNQFKVMSGNLHIERVL